MTTYNKTTLKTFFENGDVPSGQNYSDFIDSQINIVETSNQSMGGSLTTTELITPRVSATNANFTGNVSAATMYIGSIILSNITGNIASFSGLVSAGSLNVTGDVSANTVYCSAARATSGFYGSVAIVSAAGTTQGAAAVLTSTINRGKGVTDGTATGFAIPANRTGLTQIIVNDAASANLWPPTGGTINALGANAAFAMAANIPYAIYHITASAYAVK